MPLLFRCFLAALVLFVASTQASARAAEPPVTAATPIELPNPPIIGAKSWLLLEYGSGQMLAGEAVDMRIDPASLTKLMTAYTVLKAIRAGDMTVEQKVRVSQQAVRMPGSRMFAEPESKLSIDELLSGLIIQSGNDAAIVLAEAVAGSEAEFVARMNLLAGELGLSGSRFANPTGLTASDHYSTVRDLATLTVAMLRDFPEAYARYYGEKRFTHNRITQSNRNRLLWIDKTVDGVKTGHTEAAGYCLIASSVRDSRRLISVIAGAESDAARTQDSLALLNWGFLKYDALPLYPDGTPVAELPVWHGSENTVAVGFPGHHFMLAVPKGMGEQLKAKLISRAPLQAPIAAGQSIARVRFTLAGQDWGEYPVYSLSAVPVAGPFGRIYDTVRLWFQ